MGEADERAAWLEAARQVSETGQVDVLCPMNGDASLKAMWIPSSGDDEEGEFRLWCPLCGAENYLRRRRNRQ